jgi:hypothetical protein
MVRRISFVAAINMMTTAQAGFVKQIVPALPQVIYTTLTLVPGYTQRLGAPSADRLSALPFGDEILEEGSASSSSSLSEDPSSDWWEGEWMLQNEQLPAGPDPTLSPEQVATLVCRSLQWVDYPNESDGLRRIFDFFSFECRKCVTARQGGSSVDRFIRYGLHSPALLPFMGATRLDFGPVTITPEHAPLRGALASLTVQVTAPMVRTVQHASGMPRDGVTTQVPVSCMVLRLEKQRRPPMQHCWLVREVLDVRYAFAGDMGNAHVGA